MPIQESGYRHYDGPRRGRIWRSLTIAGCGVRLALARKKLVALTLLGVTPAIVIAVLIYFSTQNEDFARLAASVMGSSQEWHEQLGPSPSLARVWNTIFYTFFTFQVFPVAAIVAYVGPDLIAQDLRHRAFQLYYARPLTRLDYVVGKLLVVGVFVGIVTAVPALLLYVVGVVLGKSAWVIPQTLSTPAGILGAYLVMALVAGSVVLMCSTFTRRASYAALAWSAIVVLSDAGAALFNSIVEPKWGYVVSLRANVLEIVALLMQVQLPYPVSVKVAERDWFPSFFVLFVVVIVSWTVLLRRTASLEGEH